jgi:hypothetical protein
MPMSWNLTDTAEGSIFTVLGSLNGRDAERLRGATDWVVAHTDTVILDLHELQGCTTEGQDALGACAKRLGSNVVLYLPEHDHLRLSDERLMAAPRAHKITAAFAALNLLKTRNARRLSATAGPSINARTVTLDD